MTTEKSDKHIPLGRRDFLGGAAACALAGCATTPPADARAARFGFVSAAFGNAGQMLAYTKAMQAEKADFVFLGAQGHPLFSIRNGIAFLVLDSASLADPKYAGICRALATAPGPCVILAKGRLDAEDGKGIRNADRVRDVLAASGKVRLVLQDDGSAGAFREIGGIGYYTIAAGNVAKTANPYARIDVFPSGDVEILGSNGALSVTFRAGLWTGADVWRPGHYQVHYIYTGRGESMLHLFPDGTSMLLDCGDSMRFYRTPSECPLLPDLSRRSGEWIARYVGRVNPHGRRVDYFHLSHYHEDHCGAKRWNGGTLRAPTGDYCLCGLADAARFLTFGEIVDRAWPGFDDPLPTLPAHPWRPAEESVQMKRVYAHLAQRDGTKVSRFELGATDQFRPKDAAAAGDFHIRNICSNGRYVRKDGTVVDLFAREIAGGAKIVNENGMSCGMIVSYGAFRYYTAGDFSAETKDADGRKIQVENLLAEAVERVDVAKVNHHGHRSMYPDLVKALGARVWTACVLDQLHLTDDTCARLADPKAYPGPRTILGEYTPLGRPVEKAGRDWLSCVPEAVRREPCHVVLDVPPGGETYSLACIPARDESRAVRAVYAFVSSRAQPAAK